ncbi:MAG: acyl-CoA dehydrogenase C-terminal domain-containing protein, partial [Pseudomonadota bacterium]
QALDVPADEAFYAGKLAACAFFFKYELPKIKTELDRHVRPV